MNEIRYVGNVSYESQYSNKVHEEEVQRWGTGRRSLKKEKYREGRLEKPK